MGNVKNKRKSLSFVFLDLIEIFLGIFDFPRTDFKGKLTLGTF